MPGSVTERGRWFSPTRITAGLPLECLLRNRNDAMSLVFFLNRGNPTRLPSRFPERESDHAARPRPQVDGRFLEHLLTHLSAPRQARHCGIDDALTADGEYPARSFGLLPRVERVDQIEPRPRNSVSESVLRRVSAVFTIRRHWLNANRDAPACRDSTSCCSTVGSRQNRNVVCRHIT